MKRSFRSFLSLFLLFTTFSLFGSEVPSKDPALIWAAKNNLLAIAKLLLDRGVDVNERDLLGNTPLHAAVKYPEMVDLLIGKGAYVNSQNFLGETPLHFAVKYKKTVEILLAKGADKTIPNFIGRTSIDYCMERGTGKANQVVMELLITKSVSK